MSITDIGKEAAEESGGRQSVDPDDYERFDVTGLDYTKMHPTSAVGGTAVALRFFPGDPDDDEDRGFAGLILDDPFIMNDGDDLSGTAVFESTRDKGDDFKIVNLDDEDTAIVEDAGVDFRGNLFYGEQTDDIDSDQIVLKLTGNAGRSAAQCLDVKGKGGADVIREDDGTPTINENSGFPEFNGRLVEYFDNDSDSYTPPRFARDTQLRPDLQGETTAFLVQRLAEIDEDYDGNAYWSTVMVQDGDDFEAVEPTEEFEADETLVRATSWLEQYPEDPELEAARDAQGITLN